MGSSLKKLSSYFSAFDETRILMFGLDAAGKTTILYASKLREVISTIQTIRMNVETVKHGNINITVWDVGGRDKIRALWRHFYEKTSAIVFIIDSNDRDRIDEACHELHKMANEELLNNLPILIFANKQDLPNILTLDEIKEKLNLSKLNEMKTKWHLQPSVALLNQGIDEGFQWLATTMQSKNYLKQPIIETINDSKIVKDDLSSAWNLVNIKTLLSKFL
ncbi:unnamed protein product [Rotaria sp. Silwood2]|nr:unnamed protein product [Rotaria sp. Silwood2]